MNSKNIFTSPSSPQNIFTSPSSPLVNSNNSLHSLRSRSSPFVNSIHSPRSPRSPHSSTSSPSFPAMSLSPAISPARDDHFAGEKLSLLSLQPKFDVSCHGFPPMYSRVRKPADAMNNYGLQQAYNEPENICGVTPPGVVMELKLFFCRNKEETDTPNIRVHNLRAAKVSEDNKEVTHLIFMEEDLKLLEAMKAKALEYIASDLERNGIAESKVETIWWHDGRTPASDFWSSGMVKHSKFSTIDEIKDYASTTYKLADPILNESEANPSLGDFLGKRFEVGKYHCVRELMVALKEFFGMDVYPTFIGHGQHPSLFEIAILYTKDGKIIDHPLACKVPSGKFLMRNI